MIAELRGENVMTGKRIRSRASVRPIALAALSMVLAAGARAQSPGAVALARSLRGDSIG